MKSALELAAVFVARGAGAAGGILLSILVARISGVKGLGDFAVLISFVGIAAILARRGLDTILIRLVAVSQFPRRSLRDWSLLLNGLRTVALTSGLLAILGFGIFESNVLGVSFDGSSIVVAGSIPLIALLAVVSGYLKGIGRPWLAPFFEIGGVSLLAAASILAAISLGYTPDLTGLSALFAMSAFLMLVISLVVLPRGVTIIGLFRPSSGTSIIERLEIRRGQFAFTVIALSGFLMQAGSFTIVAPFLSDQELGLTRAAERLAIVISFPILAIEPFIASRVARSLDIGDISRTTKLVLSSSFIGAAMSALPLACFLALPEFFLGLLGPEFIEATPYLRKLAVTHFGIVMLGPFIVVLSMGGGERALMWVSGVSLIVAAISFPLLSMFYGVNGFLFGYVVFALGRGFITCFLALHRMFVKPMTESTPGSHLV